LSNVPEVPFEHVIVDLSLRDVTTSKGDMVQICQIEANVPIDLTHGEIRSRVYSFGREIHAGKPFEIEVGPFCFILIRNCCGDMGIFAIAHSIPEDPTFQSVIYKADKPIRAENSNISIDQKASFYFIAFNVSQRLRIETIPDIETHWALCEKIGDREEEEDS